MQCGANCLDFTLAEEGGFRNGLLEGRFVSHHPNGARAAEGEYRSGKESGVFARFTQAGERAEEVAYRQGMRHGVARTFYQSGQVRDEVEYVDGTRHGMAGTYHASGAKRTEGKYGNDERVGVKAEARRWTLSADSANYFPPPVFVNKLTRNSSRARASGSATSPFTKQAVPRREPTT
jgi:hypothetical protein